MSLNLSVLPQYHTSSHTQRKWLLIVNLFVCQHWPCVCLRYLCVRLCVRVWRSGKRSSCPPKCSWMSHPICSLSPRHKWTLHPLVRWLISAPLSPSFCLSHSPSSPLHLASNSAQAASSAFQRRPPCTRAPAHLAVPVKINERDTCIIQHINLEMAQSVFCLSALIELLRLLWKMIKSQERREGRYNQRRWLRTSTWQLIFALWF